jgi:hypothetical protein
MRPSALAWILFAIPFGVRGVELTRPPGWDLARPGTWTVTREERPATP